VPTQDAAHAPSIRSGPRAFGRREAAPPLRARRWQDGRFAERDEIAPAECAIALVYNGFPYAVLMASPSDVEDLARGFTLSEAIVEDASEIAAIEVRDVALGLEAKIAIPQARAELLSERQRSMAAGSACGLCGVISIERAMRRLPGVTHTGAVAATAISAAVEALPHLQEVNSLTGAVHGAGFARRDGELAAVREDVGRHNALDKLVGALAKDGVSPSDGFLVLSSRCSSEMVQKAATAGFPVMATISAPTALAIELADEAGLTLCAFARRGAFNVYTHPDRIAAA
jgi:FdhD protein